MSDQSANQGERKTQGAETPKRLYASPVLYVYGSVQALTLTGQGSLGDAGSGTMAMMSDRSTKDVLTRLADHPLGIGLYLFDYKPEFQETWGRGRYLGVMADEVETVLPAAVLEHREGYKMVYYAMLNLAAEQAVAGRLALSA